MEFEKKSVDRDTGTTAFCCISDTVAVVSFSSVSWVIVDKATRKARINLNSNVLCFRLLFKFGSCVAEVFCLCKGRREQGSMRLLVETSGKQHGVLDQGTDRREAVLDLHG